MLLKNLLMFSFCFITIVSSANLKAKVTIGEPAPLFELFNQENQLFKLQDRKGKGWTVLFFYPKAFTSGCIEQVCSYRDHIKEIRALGADVFGLSGDDVKNQAKFHQEYHLNFDLLADPNKSVIKIYGETYFILDYAKRWTFLIDSNLVLRQVFKGVDPDKDAENVINFIKKNSN